MNKAAKQEYVLLGNLYGETIKRKYRVKAVRLWDQIQRYNGVLWRSFSNMQ